MPWCSTRLSTQFPEDVIVLPDLRHCLQLFWLDSCGYKESVICAGDDWEGIDACGNCASELKNSTTSLLDSTCMLSCQFFTSSKLANRQSSI
mmetsp:Transcript_19377/g.55772  ORF Transcript_19377/g.55772 Transcript_19377/m.55772 type:complete len:92 (-) Transcript_19377:190-465(-)